jgi:hypothetical protein
VPDRSGAAADVDPNGFDKTATGVSQRERWNNTARWRRAPTATS